MTILKLQNHSNNKIKYFQANKKLQNRQKEMIVG